MSLNILSRESGYRACYVLLSLICRSSSSHHRPKNLNSDFFRRIKFAIAFRPREGTRLPHGLADLNVICGRASADRIVSAA